MVQMGSICKQQLKVTQMTKIDLNRVENILEKEDKAVSKGTLLEVRLVDCIWV